MTPRNTKQGASANARRAPSKGVARAASPSRTQQYPLRGQGVPPPSQHRVCAASQRRPRTPLDPRRSRARPSPRRGAGGCCRSSSSRWRLSSPRPTIRWRRCSTERHASGRCSAPNSNGVRARNDRLATQVDRLKTPEGVEDYARVAARAGEGGRDRSASWWTTPFRRRRRPPWHRISASTAKRPSCRPIGPWTAFLDSVFGIE